MSFLKWSRFCAASLFSYAFYTTALYAIAFVVAFIFSSSWFIVDLHAQFPSSEFVARRAELLASIDDGIVLLKANSSEKEMEQPGWIQTPSFYYFTGLANLPSAILALDGLADEAHLFVPPAPISFGVPVESLRLAQGDETAGRLGLNTVQEWSAFKKYVDGRLQDGDSVLYVEKSRRVESGGVPPGFLWIAGRNNLWEMSLQSAFPGASIRSVTEIINGMRWIKSPVEIKILDRNARLTADALLAVMRRIKPGLTQRQAEATVVSQCLELGAQGPSFWPWTMSGPNAHFQNLVRSFYDYDGLNRVMESGELVRVDIGCGSEYYGGDVGRTVPVSGRFSDEQRRVWNLLIEGYHAGLDAMQPGRNLDDIREASKRAVREEGDRSTDERLSEITAAMVSTDRGINWHIHGVGIESGEAPGDMLHEGVILAYEPMFVWKQHAYYLEDMILITSGGAEILSIELPYTAEEIEQLMSTSTKE